MKRYLTVKCLSKSFFLVSSLSPLDLTRSWYFHWVSLLPEHKSSLWDTCSARGRVVTSRRELRGRLEWQHLRWELSFGFSGEDALCFLFQKKESWDDLCCYSTAVLKYSLELHNNSTLRLVKTMKYKKKTETFFFALCKMSVIFFCWDTDSHSKTLMLMCFRDLIKWPCSVVSLHVSCRAITKDNFRWRKYCSVLLADWEYSL